MRRVYLIPNMVTALGLACGLFVIFKMNMTEPGTSNYHLVFIAAVLILLAALADVLDGAIARFIRAESEFGVQFDSLSDGIAFGVAPAVVVLKTLSIPSGTKLSFLVTGAAMLYSVCGVLRLVRFNVKAMEAKGNEVKKLAHKKHFTGLPIPVAAISAVSANLFLVSDDFLQFGPVSENIRGIIMAVVMIILGYFMISRWKFPSVKALHFRVRSFYLVLITVCIAVLLLFGALYHFAVLFVCIPWIYLIVAWVLSIIRMIAGKKSKTLEDFEPDSDDDWE
ncbi:MAG: CDP-alcohol phosphatidyltransferase family protein [Parachlamydiales bacterium]|nr:CDP-alcohol phosphatidyltransferase family protein [Parachlamydiales bacterium]